VVILANTSFLGGETINQDIEVLVIRKTRQTPKTGRGAEVQRSMRSQY
jgi:hypothetical protein